MKKILIAVDDTKGTKNAFGFCVNACACMRPDNIVLLYVEEFEGRSLMADMLPVSELTTLKNLLEGSDYKDAIDRKADTVLGHYKKTLEDAGISGIKTVRKMGLPAEEIVNTAKEEGVDMIIIGSRGKRTTHAFMGSVSREVANSSQVSVLIVK